MNAPLVIEYLRTHSAAELFAEHGVRVSPSKTRTYKASLNYDQIQARNDDPLACECRGLVVATRDGSPVPMDGPCGDLVVLARPMDRFFNHGQGAAHVVTDEELRDAVVYEKLDGTLCIVYWDPHAWHCISEPGQPIATNEGAWCVATRSVPDADEPVDGFRDATFRSLFECAVLTTYKDTWVGFCAKLNPAMTYCFELCSPRAGSGVVQYADNSPHLLAVRHNVTGAEVCATTVAGMLGLVAAESHEISALDALLAFVEARPATQAEGVVVRLRGKGGSYPRVKFKSEGYRAAHGLSSEAGSSPRNLLRIILAGQWDDVAPTTRPHLRERGDGLTAALRTWAAAVDVAYAALNADGKVEDRKTFAQAVQALGSRYPMGAMMAMWQGRVADTAEWLQTQRHTVHGWTDAFLDRLAEMIMVTP